MSDEVFYPSCVVNLQVTFEKKLWIREETGNNQFQTSPLVTGQNTGTFIMNRVPKKMTVNMKGHTTAATWNMVFDYRELPIDPRTIHSATVEIYLGTVPAEHFVDGLKHEWRPGSRRSHLQTRTPDNKIISKDLLMVGPMDDWKIDYGKDGAEVHLEGRDLRGLLLDSPLVSVRDHFDFGNGFPHRTPRRKQSNILSRLDTKKNIVELVQQILSEHDRLRVLDQGIEVIAYKDEWPNNVIPSPGAASHVPRNRRGAGGQGSNPGAAHRDLNFWDIITRYCYLVGAIPRFIGRKLEIRYAPTLHSMTQGWNRRIPFADGEERTDGNESWPTRRLVYGRDIDKMSIARKYAGANKPKIVRVVAVNPSHTGRGRQQLLEAVWPPRTVREANREGIHGSRDHVRDYLAGDNSGEVLNIPVRGVTNMAQLVSIAASFYEQIGRQEIKAEVSLDCVTSFGGSNADPDVLRMRVGEPLELLVDATKFNASSPIVSTLNRTSSMTFAEAVAEVRKFLPGEDLARAIVASARGSIMGVLRYYRTAAVDFDWNAEEGVTIKADLQNYWTPTFDPNARLAAPTARRRNHADAHAGAVAAASTAAATGAPAAPATSASPARTAPDPFRSPSVYRTERAEPAARPLRPAEREASIDATIDRAGNSRWRER